MSDTEVVETEQTEQTEAQAATATEAPAEKPAPKVKDRRPCLCRSYELVNPNDPEEAFTTGCELQTLSTFGQGHDARLVSFLVTGHADGYKIQQVTAAGTVVYATPGEAVADVSSKLQDKAEKATARKEQTRKEKADREQARADLKAKRLAEKEAKKAEAVAAAELKKAEKAKPKKAVAPTGDRTPLTEGQVRVKVGEFEYVAILDDENTAWYTDGAGEALGAAEGEYEVTELYGV